MVNASEEASSVALPVKTQERNANANTNTMIQDSAGA